MKDIIVGGPGQQQWNTPVKLGRVRIAWWPGAQWKPRHWLVRGGPGQRKRPHRPSTQPLSLHLGYLISGGESHG